MRRSSAERAPPSRYRIERARHGYRIVGPALLIWEPTLGEAVHRREEIETLPWRYPPGPGLTGRPSHPFESIVYGPVSSRRLGRSLGLSLTPAGRRVCTFECVYCEYAAGPRRKRGRWPPPDDVRAELADALADVGPLDSITISGHGEATLHPRFPDVVEAVLKEARSACRDVPVRILTNGSQAVHPGVRRALDRLDERIVKLDAGVEQVCQPSRRTPLGAMLLGLTLLRDLTLQCCFVEGEVSNIDDATIRDWVHLVAEVHPQEVQIYTIDRPPARGGIRPVSAAALEEVACRLRARTGIEAHVYPADAGVQTLAGAH